MRRVSAAHAPVLRSFLDSQAAGALVDSEKLIPTRFPPDSVDVAREFASGDDIVVEHERVWFPSYPYEWPAEMLASAGQLTLQLARAILAEGFGLKDATPYNVLFRGTKPVFVDLLSFEERTAGDPTWLPYAQFERMFILPLLMNRHFGTSMTELFLSHRDGVEPEEVYRYASWALRLRPSFLGSVSIPTWLTKRAQNAGTQLYRAKQIEPEKAEFIVGALLRRLSGRLRKITPAAPGASGWSSYMRTLSYSEEEFDRKNSAVGEWLAEIRPRTVLDIGCNTGHFSALAARGGARVVAIDYDPVVVGATWKRATSEDLDVLPLTVNIARPTPAAGWRNSEYPSFVERARGAFDIITMLAIVHHLMVTERIPLAEVFSLAAELTARYVIVEYVAKDDPMFLRLTRGREALHSDFTQEVFERLCSQQFTVVRKQPLKGNLRCLYLLQKRES